MAAEQLDGRERVKSSQDEESATELYQYTWSPQHERIVKQFLEDHVCPGPIPGIYVIGLESSSRSDEKLRELLC